MQFSFIFNDYLIYENIVRDVLSDNLNFGPTGTILIQAFDILPIYCFSSHISFHASMHNASVRLWFIHSLVECVLSFDLISRSPVCYKHLVIGKMRPKSHSSEYESYKKFTLYFIAIRQTRYLRILQQISAPCYNNTVPISNKGQTRKTKRYNLFCLKHIQHAIT